MEEMISLLRLMTMNLKWDTGWIFSSNHSEQPSVGRWRFVRNQDCGLSIKLDEEKGERDMMANTGGEGNYGRAGNLSWKMRHEGWWNKMKRWYTFLKSGCFFSKPYPTLSSSHLSELLLARLSSSLKPVTFLCSIHHYLTNYSRPELVPLKARAFSFVSCLELGLACSSPSPHYPPYPIMASLLFNHRPGHVLIFLHQNALIWNGMHLKTECLTFQVERLWGSRNLEVCSNA